MSKPPLLNYTLAQHYFLKTLAVVLATRLIYMYMTEWIQYDINTGIISINAGAKADDTIRVQRLDNDGSICEKFFLEQTGSAEIDTNHWTNGTWFIRVEKKQEVQLKRILITK